MPLTPQAIADRLIRSAETLRAVADLAPDVAGVAALVRERLDAGGNLLTCGNGGSAAHALHLAEELVGKFKAPRDPIGALCLNADPTQLTCIANDFGFDHVFERPVRSIGRAGDALVVISTSGGSRNLILALEAARAAGIATAGLLGRDGGACLGLCDRAVVVPAEDSDLIQEAHQAIVHLIVEGAEAP